MNKIFMRILDFANYVGNVTEANLYECGDFLNVKYENEKGEVFSISVTKKEKEEKEND